MTPNELERYLHEHIPLSAAMQASVVAADADAVVLSAPLAPNINHRETVFGGSASALAILSAWSLVRVRLGDECACRIVIQRNSVEYEAPVTGSFTARAELADADAWPRFLQMLERRGRARVAVRAVVESEGVVGARFEGTFVAIRT